MNRMLEAREIRNDFVTEYCRQDPWKAYMSMCSVRIERHDGKTPYIYVGLTRELPPELVLPTVYNNLRVSVEVIGDIVAGTN